MQVTSNFSSSAFAPVDTSNESAKAASKSGTTEASPEDPRNTPILYAIPWWQGGDPGDGDPGDDEKGGGKGGGGGGSGFD